MQLHKEVENNFNRIIQKSNFLADVRKFEKFDDSSDYYFIEENLNQLLINQLDAMYDLIKNSPLLSLLIIDELDKNAELNEIKSIFIYAK